jgi:hypothetical protein
LVHYKSFQRFLQFHREKLERQGEAKEIAVKESQKRTWNIQKDQRNELKQTIDKEKNMQHLFYLILKFTIKN